MATTNMLEQMASGIVEEKETKGRGLTPLVAERPAPKPAVPDVPGSFLTNEGIADVARDLRAHAANLIAIADALDGTTGLPTDGSGAVGDLARRSEMERKAIEKAADEKAAAAQAAAQPEADAAIVEAAQDVVAQEEFDSALAAKTAAAQAAVFTPQAESTGVLPEWQCPNGHDTVEEKVSPRGRHFARCTTCGEFQK